MKSLSMITLVAGLLAAALQVTADPVKLGWHERGGVFVDKGETATQDGNVILEQNAKFYKSGAGRLDLPLSKVNAQKPYSMTVLGGTLNLEAGADATVDVATPPAAFQKAALWLDTSSTVVTGANLVAKWCDVRETDTASPKRWYAVPRWDALATDYKDVPPLLSEYDGRAGVYFYGRKSNLYMQFATNGTNTALTGIRHAFVVHGVKDCWGCALGYSVSREGSMTIGADSFVRALSDCVTFFSPSFDRSMDYSGARFFLNGEAFDPYATKPTTGVQMLEVDSMDIASKACWLFRCGFETYYDGSKNKGNQGGDYLSEIVLFTKPLSEAERMDVSRYLLKKWNLPRLANNDVRPLRPAGTVNVATNAAAVISGGEGTMTEPLVFTGEGTVTKTGASILTMAPLGDEPFRGTFELEEGGVLSCGGRPLPLAAQAGSVYDSSAYKHTGEATAQENFVRSGFKLTRTADADAGVARKTGTGEVRFSSVSSDVGTLDVQNGVVTLESRPGGAPKYAPNETNAVVVVPNGSFETPVTLTGDGRLFFQSLNDWSYVWLEGGTTCAYSGTAKGWSNWSAMPPPDGCQALTLSTISGGQTTVKIPKAGRYRLSFNAIGRYHYRKGGNYSDYVHQVDVYFYKNGASSVKVGSASPNASVFARFTYEVEAEEAGEYRLRFVVNDRCGDETTTIDDVRLVYDAEPAEAVAFKVPNGDFEQLAPRTTTPHRYSYFTSLDEAKDWTFAIPSDATSTDRYVGLVSPLKCLRWYYSISLYRFGSVDLGGNMLGFLHKGGTATTATFTAPKGTFKLQAKAAWTPTCLSSLDCTSQPQIRARLLRDGGEAVDLGTLTPTSTLLATMTWPNAFTFDEPEAVTLELSLNNTNGGGVVDDLVFVTPSEDPGELLSDGGFELVWKGDPWKCSGDKSYYANSGAGYFGYAANTPQSAWGYSAFQGGAKISFVDTALATQDLTIPSAGLHRLTVHACTQINDDAATTRNPLRFWITKIDSGVTNVIDTMAMPNTYNWFERTYLFDVPSAGDYRFGIQSGCGLMAIDSSKNAWRRSFVDGVSIRRVLDAPAETPVVPASLKIKVASGSRLVLNYPGTVRVRRLSLGGSRIPTGTTVSAADCPDYLGGLGKIEVVGSGKGLMCILR